MTIKSGSLGYPRVFTRGLSDRLPDRMPEHMSDRMPEYMPDRMSEYMSGKLSLLEVK